MMRFLLPAIALLIAISCKSPEHSGIYNEGRLEYKITYLNAESDHYDPSFLPKKMVLEFNQDYSINRIDGFMGFFKLGNMTYFKNHKVKTHLKVLDKNYSFQGGRNEMMCCFDCMEGMHLEEDTVTRTIAGLKSYRMLAHFDTNRESFEVFYTKEINLSDPNATNPYRNINGILTSFRLIMGPYLMQFEATKFDPTAGPDQELEIPSGSTEVQRSEMIAILNHLMEQNI